jgi:hypothetical protein
VVRAIGARGVPVLVVLAVVLWWYFCQPPAEPHVDVDPQVRGPARTTLRIPIGLPCADQLALAEAMVERARLEAQGRPQPFDDTLPAEVQPEAVEAEIVQLRVDNPDLVIDEVDCSEYPCLVVWTGMATLLMEPSTQVGPWQWLMFADDTEVHFEGQPRRSWNISARIAPGQPVASFRAAAEDPAAQQRVQWRVDQAMEAIRERTGGWAPSPREEAEAELADLIAASQTAPAGTWQPMVEQARARVEVLAAEEALVRAAGPQQLGAAPGPCGGALDRATAELDRLHRQIWGPPTLIPDDVDPAFLPAVFEARLQESLAQCPTFAARFVDADCSEFPCAVLWRSDGPPREPCAPWDAVPRDPAVTNNQYTYRDASGQPVALEAVVYRPPGWYDRHPTSLASGRVLRRLDELVLDGRTALGLRAVTPLEALEVQIERLEGTMDEESLEELEEQAAFIRSAR